MKIIDCFTFFNEFELAEARMEYLYDHVDHFVITECNYTYSGAPKTMLFQEHRDRFAKFEQKIIYAPFILSQEEYDSYGFDTDDYHEVCWVLERNQRNHISSVLDQFDDNDIFLVSDCDEIHNIDVFDRIRAHFSDPNSTPIVLGQEYYMYNLERRQRYPGGFADYWYMPFAIQKRHLLIYPASNIRGYQFASDLPKIAIHGAGWHLHCFMDAPKIVTKLKYYAHRGAAEDGYLDTERLASWIREDKSFVGNYHELEITTPEHFPDHFLRVFGKYFNINPRAQ